MSVLYVPHLMLTTLSISILALIALNIVLKRPRHMSTATAALFLPLIASTLLATFYSGGKFTDGVYLSAKYLGDFNFLVDYVSGPIALTILGVSMVISIYAYPYMERKFEEEGEQISSNMKLFYVLYYIFSISMYGSVISTNFAEFYLFLEVGLISSFILINNYGYGDRRKIALLYFVWTHIGAVLFLVGALAFGYYEGSLNVFGSGGNIVYTGELMQSVAKAVFALMLVGMLVKAAALGFHLWLPYAHAEAPTPISALLSPLLIGIGPYVIFRFLYPLFPAQFGDARLLLAVWGALTIVYGGLNALFEKDFKRFLAYSSISQMGYLIISVAAGNIYGFIGLILHYIAHAFGKAILFASAGSVIYHENGLRDMRQMGGMLKTLPMTGNTALLGFFTITGMPPTIGFWSELFIVRGVVEAFYGMGAEGLAIIALLFIGFSLSISYSFYRYKEVFQGPPKFGERKKEDPFIIGSLITLAILAIALFIVAPVYANDLTGYLNSLKALAGGA